MLMRLIPLGFIFFLSACAGATIVSQVYYDHSELIDVFRYAAGDRDFLVEVQGNPTADPKVTFDGAVVAAMHGKHGGPPTEFTLAPSERTRSDYRFVLVFGAPQYYGAKSACGGVRLDRPRIISGRIGIQAAFCHKERPLSYARVDFGPITGALDPRLAHAVGEATLSLVPRYDPDPKGDNEQIRITN